MPQLTNFTYDEIAIGQESSWSRTVTERDIQLFAAVSGDVNPVHLDETYAATTPFGQRIAHGMLSGAFISAALAMALPGPGSIYLSQSLKFRLPVKIGDTITVKLEVSDKNDRRRIVTLDCRCYNQEEKLVLTGTAEVIAPTEKISMECPEPARVTLET